MTSNQLRLLLLNDNADTETCVVYSQGENDADSANNYDDEVTNTHEAYVFIGMPLTVYQQ